MPKSYFIGHLGNDPEVKEKNGKTFVVFSVAEMEYKKQDALQETQWISCAAYEKLGNIATQYLKKGSKVFLEGRTSSYLYTAKEGIQKAGTRCFLTSITMLDAKEKTDSSTYSQYTQAQTQNVAQPAKPAAAVNNNFYDEDVPF